MVRKYLRFLWGLRKFIQERSTPEEAIALAKEKVRDRIQHREENFLNFVERGVYGNPNSPYLRLLQPRKIALQDIQKRVGTDGLEPTLDFLRQEGVYYTVAEYKGMQDVVRNGLKFRAKESEFDNPFLSAAYEVRSGATRSAGTRIRIDFDYLIQRSLYDALLLSTHNALTSPIANWFPIFPGAPGINSSLRFCRIGNPPKKWFSQVDRNHLKLNWERRFGTNYIIYMTRLFGAAVQKPEYVSLNDASLVAQWAAAALNESEHCVVYTFASSAVRVCMAAREHNLNIKGAIFLVTGEPLTETKRREIESTGARAVPVYGISEAGVIAAGCDQPHSIPDHCHVYKDSIAITKHQRIFPAGDDAQIETLLFTSLLYESPKILINIEMGDTGTLTSGSCPCQMGELGFDLQIHTIGSFEKLTGEGVTFVNTDFVHIIEEVLPRQFGGESTDYQIVEEEDSTGITHLNLLVSPRVRDVDEQSVVQVFLRHLLHSDETPGSWARSGSQMWSHVGTVRVKREYPIPTKRAKILPFHVVRNLEKMKASKDS